MTSAIMLVIELSLFQSESSRRADGEFAEAGAAKKIAANAIAVRIFPNLVISPLPFLRRPAAER